jgi:DNA-binding MarR family transcriptional regulator
MSRPARSRPAQSRPGTGDDVVDALLATAHHLRHAVNGALRDAVGLTLPRLKVLELLDRQGPLRSRDCSDALGVAPRTMTENVDDLAAGGLLTRVTHPTDRRAVLIALTPAGQDALARARCCREAYVRSVTGHLVAGERAELARLLESVLGSVRAAAGSAGEAQQAARSGFPL